MNISAPPPNLERNIELSVVIPVFNEASNILPLQQSIIKILNTLNVNYEIIWINDGSEDSSLKELYALPKIGAQGTTKIISLKTRYGKAAAMQAGFDHLRGKIVITLDGDLQNDPTDIPAMLTLMKRDGYDVVCGWRHTRHDTWIRRISSRIGNISRKIFSGERIHDVGCMLKVFKVECIQNIYLSGALHRFITWIFLKQGFKLGEMKVRHHLRANGVAKYNIKNRLPESLPVIFQLAFGNFKDIIKRRNDFEIKELKEL